MIKLAIITSQRFWIDKNGKYYRRSGSLRPVLLRSICKYFEKVIIVARIESSDEDIYNNMQMVDIPNLEFFHLPSFTWPIGYIHNYKKIKSVIYQALSDCDAVILRSSPGLPYLGLKIARTLKITTIFHLIGSNFETVFANKNRIKFTPLRFLLAFIIHLQTKKIFKSVDLRAAVSNHSLKVLGGNSEDDFVQPNYCLEDSDFVIKVQGLSDAKMLNCLYVGRLEMPKNVQTFLKAVSTLSDDFSNIKVKIAGDGGYLDNLKELVKKIGISDKVNFLGWVGQKGELQKLYREADLVFLLSESEGLPVSLGEAAAASVPAIASNRGGTPEFIKDGYNGYLIEPDDANRCKDILVSIMSDNELLRKLQKNAFESAQNFHVDKVGKRFYDMVKEGINIHNNKL